MLSALGCTSTANNLLFLLWHNLRVLTLVDDDDPAIILLTGDLLFGMVMIKILVYTSLPILR